MKTIGIIGHGYVGQAIDRFFEKNYNIVLYDPFKDWNVYKTWSNEDGKDCGPLTKKINSTKDEINKCDLAIVCLPTPMNENTKECDVSLVEEAIEWLETPLILIKSTIEPGTTDRLRNKTGKRIVFSPEFIGESKYWSPYKFDTDMKECPFVILGGNSGDTTDVLNIILKVTGPKKFYYQIKAKEAEMIKYMINTYFGLKVTFANEMKNICDAMGINYYVVREGWGLDPRVEKMHTVVFEDEKGFSGKCFPKDINALVKVSQKFGYEPELIKEILKSNNRFRNNI